MRKVSFSFVFLLILSIGILLIANPVFAESLANKLKGKILLQVESKGEAWYVSPADGKRYYMGRPDNAFDLMRNLGVGINNNDIEKIQIADANLLGIVDNDRDGLSKMIEDSLGTDDNNFDTDNDGYRDRTEVLSGNNPNGSGKLNIDNNFSRAQAGKILLQVERNGEAWYVNPSDNKRYFLGRPADAFNLMRSLSIGISNNDLNKITLVEAQSNTFKYIKDDIQVIVDCGYEGCYEKKYASCEPVIMQADSGSFGAVEYKIIGKGVTGCNITFKYTKYSDSSWVNKEMTCEFDNKISYNDAFTKVFSGVTTGEVVCTGPLYDILRPKSAAQSVDSDDLWSIHDKVNLALKNKDVASFNIYSYKQVTPDQASQFASIAPFLYEQSAKIIKSNYVNKWQDDKQAIYSTNPIKTDDADIYGYKQGSIMFIKKDGFWKELLDSPERGWSVSRAGTNETAAQVEQLLQEMIIDSDKDGITNMEEVCGGAHQGDSTCVKTDPNKRDTNGNGWWDGIEAEMK